MEADIVWFLSAVIINSLIEVIGNACGIESEHHYVFDVMSPLQFFLFIFILASVTEEVLFRGFLEYPQTSPGKRDQTV